MSSLDMVFHQSRRSGERERGLSDVVARVGLDATGTVFSFLLRGLGPIIMPYPPASFVALTTN